MVVAATKNVSWTVPNSFTLHRHFKVQTILRFTVSFCHVFGTELTTTENYIFCIISHEKYATVLQICIGIPHTYKYILLLNTEIVHNHWHRFYLVSSAAMVLVLKMVWNKLFIHVMFSEHCKQYTFFEQIYLLKQNLIIH